MELWTKAELGRDRVRDPEDAVQKAWQDEDEKGQISAVGHVGSNRRTREEARVGRLGRPGIEQICTTCAVKTGRCSDDEQMDGKKETEVERCVTGLPDGAGAGGVGNFGTSGLSLKVGMMGARPLVHEGNDGKRLASTRTRYLYSARVTYCTW